MTNNITYDLNYFKNIHIVSNDSILRNAFFLKDAILLLRGEKYSVDFKVFPFLKLNSGILGIVQMFGQIHYTKNSKNV